MVAIKLYVNICVSKQYIHRNIFLKFVKKEKKMLHGRIDDITAAEERQQKLQIFIRTTLANVWSTFSK